MAAPAENLAHGDDGIRCRRIVGIADMAVSADPRDLIVEREALRITKKRPVRRRFATERFPAKNILDFEGPFCGTLHILRS